MAGESVQCRGVIVSMSFAMPFEITSTHVLIVVTLLLSAIGGLAMLRVLAIYRHAQISPYELAREARRLRAEYEAQMASAGRPVQSQHDEDGNEVIVV